MSSIKEAYIVMPQPRRPLTAAKSPRKFVLLAIGSAVACFIAFILMQLAFGVGGSAGVLAFEILGFVLFVLFLASAATTLVGIIGMLLRLAGRERARRDSNP